VVFPALDALIAECSQKFSSESMGIVCGVDAILECESLRSRKPN